jgi:competence protein ComEC
MAPQPDILVSNDGHTVGVRGKDGQLRLMQTRKDAFLVREWLTADADVRTAGSTAEGVSCDDAGCVVQTGEGAFIALSIAPEAFADDCTRAAIIVTTRQAPADCKALVLDRNVLQRQGPLVLYRTQNGYSITAAKPRGTDRPWSPAVADAEPEAPALKSTPSRPVDATPAESDLQPDD